MLLNDPIAGSIYKDAFAYSLQCAYHLAPFAILQIFVYLLLSYQRYLYSK